MANVLILLAQDICHGILDSMAYNFGDELNKLGIETSYYDIKKDELQKVIEYINGETLAIVDFYSGVLNVNTSEGEKLFDIIGKPVFQFIFDYPIYIEDILGYSLNNYHALCMDRHYVDALRDIYSVDKAYFFPVPGKEGRFCKPWEDRSHDLVFVGSYVNYRSILTLFDDCNDEIKQFVMNYFNKMVQNTNLNHMQALEATLDDMSMQYDNDLLHRFFLQYGKVGRAARAYVREQIIMTLLEAGFSVDVYTDTWKDPVWSKYTNLIVHEGIKEDEYLAVLGDSKISLNCLYGNKAGYTERHGNSMLNGAVVVADRTEYLEEIFIDQDDIVFYDLENIQYLPSRVQWIIDNPDRAEVISRKARNKAMDCYTWKKACELFLQIFLGELEG